MPNIAEGVQDSFSSSKTLYPFNIQDTPRVAVAEKAVAEAGKRIDQIIQAFKIQDECKRSSAVLDVLSEQRTKDVVETLCLDAAASTAVLWDLDRFHQLTRDWDVDKCHRTRSQEYQNIWKSVTGDDVMTANLIKQPELANRIILGILNNLEQRADSDLRRSNSRAAAEVFETMHYARLLAGEDPDSRAAIETGWQVMKMSYNQDIGLQSAYSLRLDRRGQACNRLRTIRGLMCDATIMALGQKSANEEDAKTIAAQLSSIADQTMMIDKVETYDSAILLMDESRFLTPEGNIRKFGYLYGPGVGTLGSVPEIQRHDDQSGLISIPGVTETADQTTKLKDICRTATDVMTAYRDQYNYSSDYRVPLDKVLAYILSGNYSSYVSE